MATEVKIIKSINFTRSIANKASPELIVVQFEDGSSQEIKTNYITPEYVSSQEALAAGLISIILMQQERIRALEENMQYALDKLIVL